MPLNNNEFTSYGEFMASIKGDESIEKDLVDEFVNKTVLMSDLPVQEASGTFEDHTPHSEPWEYNKKSHTAMLDEGARLYKDSIYTSKDSMSLRKTGIAVKFDSYIAQGDDGRKWRANQIKQRVRDLGLDKEHDFVWGNPRIDKKVSLGIMPRFNLITDFNGVVKSGEHKGEVYPYLTLDAGGTSNSGNLCSILFVHPSATNGVAMLVPNKSRTDFPGGLYYDPGDFEKKDRQENGVTVITKEAYDTFYNMSGVTINNRRACVRICNIDIYSKEGLDKLVSSMYEALEAVSEGVDGDFIAYCPRELRVKLRQHLDNKVNPANYSERIKPQAGDFSLGEFNLRALRHLNVNEARVV